MQVLIDAFYLILYKPLFNALVFLYDFLPGRDFGIAVIVLTVLIRLILYPTMIKSLKSQKKIKEIQPKLEEIKNKHKDDKEKQAKETMALYSKEKVNPFGGCLPLLVQLPILIALYRVFWHGFEPGQMANLYSFISNPGQINPYFLGFLDLSKTSFVLAILAGVVQFIQSKNIISNTPGDKEDKAVQIGNQMAYFFPVFTIIILLRLPAAIGLYWITTALFTLIQQKIVYRSPIKEDSKE
jgi:YidC/Oxa1 family membrane protein insertase